MSNWQVTVASRFSYSFAIRKTLQHFISVRVSTNKSRTLPIHFGCNFDNYWLMPYRLAVISNSRYVPFRLGTNNSVGNKSRSICGTSTWGRIWTLIARKSHERWWMHTPLEPSWQKQCIAWVYPHLADINVNEMPHSNENLVSSWW